ncbi:UNVERIFIED_CONTAM: hypothetical protein ACS92_05110 [Bacillus cereus]
MARMPVLDRNELPGSESIRALALVLGSTGVDRHLMPTALWPIVAIGLAEAELLVNGARENLPLAASLANMVFSVQMF